MTHYWWSQYRPASHRTSSTQAAVGSLYQMSTGPGDYRVAGVRPPVISQFGDYQYTNVFQQFYPDDQATTIFNHPTAYQGKDGPDWRVGRIGHFVQYQNTNWEAGPYVNERLYLYGPR